MGVPYAALVEVPKWTLLDRRRGVGPVALDQITDAELFTTMIAVDQRLMEQGYNVSRRSMEVPRLTLLQYGIEECVIFTAAPRPRGAYQRVEDMFDAFYSRHDRAIGGHIGVFLFRDIFARVSLPSVYGRMEIKLIDSVDLTPLQKRAVLLDPILHAMLVDQVIDVGDADSGFEMLIHPKASEPLVTKLLNLSRFHLHATAAILTGGYDYRGAVQSAILSSELVLKAGAAIAGATEADLKDSKKFGHNRENVLDKAAEALPGLDRDRVARVIAAQPNYVENRYSDAQPSKIETGHLAMGAQYVAAEIIRLISSQDFRAALNTPIPRSYPA